MGFTLIEVTIAIFLFSAIIAASAFVFITILGEWSRNQMRSDLRQGASVAFEKLTRELEEAREITSAKTESVSFWWQDSDGDNLRDSGEVVTYSWDGAANTELKRGESNIAFNIKSFRLIYRNQDGTVLTPATDLSPAARDSVRRVELQLTLAREDEEVSLVASVSPRNLRQARGPW